MNILIIQARCGSSRLKEKIFLKLNEKEILLHIVEKCKLSKKVNKVIIATSTNIEDDKIYNFCNTHSIDCYRGDERDLINRYYYLCKLLNPKNIIRITSDCPFIDVEELDKMITYFENNNYDYIYNTDELDNKNIYPEGSDIEIFNMKSIEYIWNNEKKIREHSVGIIRLKKDFYKNYLNINFYDFKLNELQLKNNFLSIALSIDTPNDYNIAKFIFEDDNFKNRTLFSYKEILYFLDENYEKYEKLKNSKNFERTGQELYAKAKKIIPGGTQLLSKRPEMFLPNQWPSYYSKVEGITVTDLDGNKYIDMGINGIGSCILGANDKDINNAVIECINRGNMSTLNHPNEVYLTEKLIELHPWAGMARYTRASGEACSVAVRIARAYSNKYKIAFCGYHGWHDWYLATNINSSGLDKHLLGGLSSIGVPPTLEGTIYPFTYNKIEELEELLKTSEFGVIIMEPMRSVFPENKFLEKVRALADQYNCVLIFDEVTSGFRITNGGLHKIFNVNPDITVFGKAISNGFPLGVVLGKKEVMEIAQETFISSTYWTEGIGFTAGLATINKFIELNVAENIKNNGEYFQNRLKKIVEKHSMKITVGGLPCISTFSFQYENPLAIKTLFIQEMLKKGYLTTVALYLTNIHTKEIIDKYLNEINNFIEKYKEDIETGSVEKYLDGPICHGGFQRVN
jgi:glutamate-1-semialdehyde aminotransferase/spore coat polysaccharide biosynthesis protein SpsF (cytidylyltransferase family)